MGRLLVAWLILLDACTILPRTRKEEPAHAEPVTRAEEWPGGSGDAPHWGPAGERWPGCSERDGDLGCLWRVRGRLSKDQMWTESACASADEQDLWIRWPAARGCDPSHCGIVEMPRGMPAEMAYWWAMADWYRQRQPQRIAVRTRTVVLDKERRQVDVFRAEFRFTLAPGLECEALDRFYQEEERAAGSFAEEAVEVLRREEDGPSWDRAQSLGLLEEGGGEATFEQCRVGESPDLAFEMRLFWSFDIDDLWSPGQVLDRVLRCRSASPIRAAALEGFAVQLERVPGSSSDLRSDGGEWRLCLCPLR